MTALLLARIQFAFTIGFHFLFPAMTLGTALILLISETLYLIRKDETYKKITDFLVKILGLIFVIGAATGIVMEFSFGTNWSGYSRAVGDIFGPILAAEGVIAFFWSRSSWECFFLAATKCPQNYTGFPLCWFLSVVIFPLSG